MPGVVVAVGTDASRSPARFARAPSPGKKSVLVLPNGGFTGRLPQTRQRLADVWGAGPVIPELPDKPTSLVVLVSGEPPARLGARLRRISRDSRMKGKLLAVYSLSGPLRLDLPSAMLSEGNLAGVGVAEASTVGSARVVGRITDLAAALAAAGDSGRVEHASGAFVWFY
jgi:hypothetical protein